MSDFKIHVQDIPLCNSDPKAMVVSQVRTREEAFVLVYDTLTRQGKVVDTSDSRLKKLDLDVAVIRRAGVEWSTTLTSTLVLSLEPYEVRKPKGTIQACTV